MSKCAVLSQFQFDINYSNPLNFIKESTMPDVPGYRSAKHDGPQKSGQGGRTLLGIFFNFTFQHYL